MIDFNDFEFHKDKVPSNYYKKKMFFKEQMRKFQDDLNDFIKQNEYFNQYDPDSVNNFLYEYAERKAFLAEHYEYYITTIERTKEIKFKSEAEDLLEMIRQKKLFNLQLQWRAEKIKIKEIRMCYDFQFWEKYIDACPFIPPITDGEITVMKQFLKTDEFHDRYYNFYNWQDYDIITEKNDEGDYENMPGWYEFYDSLLGTGPLLLLPDIHGPKEDHYANIGREDYHKQREEEMKKNPPKPYIPAPPSISAGPEETLKVAKLFEKDKHYIELFQLWNDQFTSSRKEHNINTEEINEAVELLEEADFPVYMPGGYEWREAIILCAQQYKSSVLLEELNTVYEEYLMLQTLGISKSNSVDIQKEYDNDTVVKIYRDFILRGRELSGEPMDFNF